MINGHDDEVDTMESTTKAAKEKGGFSSHAGETVWRRSIHSLGAKLPMGNEQSGPPKLSKKEAQNQLRDILSSAEFPQEAEVSTPQTMQESLLWMRLGSPKPGEMPSFASIRHALGVRGGDFDLIAEMLEDEMDQLGMDEISRSVFVRSVSENLPVNGSDLIYTDLLTRIFNALDASGEAEDPTSGEMEPTITIEAAVMVAALFAHKSDSEAAAHRLFNLIDVDKDGDLSAEELAFFAGLQLRISSICQGQREPIDVEKAQLKAQEMFLDADLDGDGNVSVDEWAAWYEENISNAHLPTPAFDEMRVLMNFPSKSWQHIFETIDAATMETDSEGSHLSKDVFIEVLCGEVNNEGKMEGGLLTPLDEDHPSFNEE
jgi:Ca2+-binding EF-hand superfamily protein